MKYKRNLNLGLSFITCNELLREFCCFLVFLNFMNAFVQLGMLLYYQDGTLEMCSSNRMFGL